MGGDLEELSIGELDALQQQMSDARLVIRDRKVNVLKVFWYNYLKKRENILLFLVRYGLHLHLRQDSGL